MGIIYSLENKVNGKIYVGQTVQPFNERMNGHLHGKQYIDRAIQKYGIENFKIMVVQCSESLLDWMEQKQIKEMKSLSPNGYNLNTGGHKNRKLSNETKSKIGKSNSKPHSWWIGEKNPLAKSVLCIETKEIFSCIKMATDKYHIYPLSIGLSCNGKQKTAGGYHWRFI